MANQTIAELFNLTGKGAIVTGGAMGIGQDIAHRLAEAGAGVIISDNNLEAANETAEQIKARGGKAQAIYGDASRIADAAQVTQAALKAFGSLDILVNNAGIYPRTPFLEMSEEAWDKVLDINLKGMFFYSQAASQEMIKTGRGGKIVNIASVASLHPNTNMAHYCSSKGGVAMLTKALALELAPHNILVNAVAPGGVLTAASRGSVSEEFLQKRLERIPLGRMGEPDDIAKTVLFLASAAADYVTGSLIIVDGGYLLS